MTTPATPPLLLNCVSWVECHFWYFPSPHAFSLLEWYILPLSNFNSSLYFLLMIQTMFLILNLVSFPAFLPPESLMQAVHWGSPLCPKPAAKKTLQWFPFKQKHLCNKIFYTFLIHCSLSFSPHWLKPNSVPPLHLIDPQIPRLSVLNPFPPCIFFLSSSQFLSPGLHPSLLHLTSSSSSLARGSSLLFCCSSPACAVREEEWDSM